MYYAWQLRSVFYIYRVIIVVSFLNIVACIGPKGRDTENANSQK